MGGWGSPRWIDGWMGWMDVMYGVKESKLKEGWRVGGLEF